MGDFNLDLLKISQNAKADAFTDCMLSFSFHPLIDAPTRITTSSATLLDNIFVNTDMNLKSGILITDLSDHLPVFAITSSSFSIIDNADQSFTMRSINNDTINNFCTQIMNLSIEVTDDANSSYNLFTKQFIDLYNKCFPQRK